MSAPSINERLFSKERSLIVNDENVRASKYTTKCSMHECSQIILLREVSNYDQCMDIQL